MSKEEARRQILAFPQTKTGASATDPLRGILQQATRGMTLRDYFAAAALPACVQLGVPADQVAARAFKIADAMMDAREK